MIFKGDTFQLSHPYQSIKFAMLYQLRVEGVGYVDIIPIVGSIVIANEDLYFIGGQVAVADAVFILQVAQVVFVLSIG